MAGEESCAAIKPHTTPLLVPPIAPIPSLPSLPWPLAPLPHRLPPPPPRPLSMDTIKSGDLDSVNEGVGDPSNTTDLPEYEISEESKIVRERQEKAMQELLMKRRASALAVPTNDMAVRSRLRRLGDPVTLFGEREMERRDRLRSIMVKLDSEGQLERLMRAHDEEEAALALAAKEYPDEEVQYPFYTEGSKVLLEARVMIVRYSIARAAARLQRARKRRDDADVDLEAETGSALKHASFFTLDCSEIGDDRPLSGCSFAHDGSLLATCSLSGVAKLWSLPDVRTVATLKGHTERATDVVFSPSGSHLVTASADQTAALWDSNGHLLRKFEGHLDRLARTAFHPSGNYLGTASFDKTWRLWDVETGTELLLQEGHSRSVYGISFHPDGSLAASSGIDALARVWDLRSGRSILALEGHVKPVLGICFSPNGYHLATGGEDNTCRIWDLRKRKSLYIIPAHSKLISQLKFEPVNGCFLATASYDTTVRVWSARDYKPVKTLSAHEAKVTSLDVMGDGCHIVSVSHDRTIKLWSSRKGGCKQESTAMEEVAD